jgi:LytR cell envelope-related transcriptional attenuator
MDLVQEVGAYAGLAAVVGLAVLSALYFSQARDLKRLREWAGRAPERTAEAVARAQQAPQGAVRPVTAKPAQPGQAAKPAQPAPAAQPGAKSPVPATPGAQAAAAAAAKPAQPAKPGEPAKAPPVPGKPAPATAAAAAGAAAKPAQADGADDKTKVPEPAKPGAGEPAAPSPATNGTDREIKASPGPGQAPKVAAASAGAAPAASSAVNKAPAPPKPPPAKPAAPKPSGTQARPVPPKPPSLPRSQTAVLPAQGPPPEEKGGWLPAPRYIALLIAGVLVVGAGATYAATELLGQDDEKSKAGQADEKKASASDENADSSNPPPAEKIDPGTVTVAVLNGTSVEGLARRISDKVANAGFQKGNVTNAQNLEGSRAESVVLYASGAKAEARVVADKLGISQIEEIDSQSQGLAGNATVVVIVGQDQA